MHDILLLTAIGAGATLVMDAWLLLLNKCGIPTLILDFMCVLLVIV